VGSLDTMRRFYARFVTADIDDPRITEAFAAVPREAFVGPGPWKIRVDGGYLDTETDNPVVLYQDILVALSPEDGIHNGQPTLHAKCLAAAAPKPGERVIHVGAGTGYYTAILAHLVGPAGRVEAFELREDMVRRATANLAGYPAVTMHPRSALEQPIPVADVIYVSAGVTGLPSIWLDALSVGGRLVLPMTPGDQLGVMLAITRTSNTAYAARTFGTVGFIPCTGARDDAEAQALRTALETRPAEDLRSLRRDSLPDETAWLVGSGWWLSTKNPGSSQ
jgi:protein-L-isoaspartate(D-aspartate) O-methyltransferase